jgi:hypothetical protein
MAYKNITGLWKSKTVEGSYSFRLTPEVKQMFAEAPENVYINVITNQYKREDNHPDFQMSYKEPSAEQSNPF